MGAMPIFISCAACGVLCDGKLSDENGEPLCNECGIDILFPEECRCGNKKKKWQPWCRQCEAEIRGE